MTDTRDDHGKGNALAWFQSIVEMVDALRAAENLSDDPEGDDTSAQRDAAGTTIRESVLCVEVRSGWFVPGNHPLQGMNAAEYRILLTTGGPAAQITGDLDEHGQPETARLEYQDWFKPWTPLDLRCLAELVDPRIVAMPRKSEASIEMCLTADEKAKDYLLTFAQQFYFGEG